MWIGGSLALPVADIGAGLVNRHDGKADSGKLRAESRTPNAAGYSFRVS
jgi:hypothetical protein